MQIRKMSDGKPFQMGQGDLRHVFGPDNGAKHLTFNYCRFEPDVRPYDRSKDRQGEAG